MYFGSREERDKEARRRIEDYREMAALYAVIKPVILEYDGKVYNCRFDAAIKEAGEKAGKRVYCYRSYYNKRLIEIHGCSGRNSNMYTIAAVNLDKCPDGKRISADLFLASARDRREGFLKDAAALEKAMPEIDNITGYIEQLKKQLDAVLEPLSHDTRDLYGLNLWITSH